MLFILYINKIIILWLLKTYLYLIDDVRTVKKLLLRGANKDIKNNENITPEELAFKLEYIEIGNLLKHISCFRKYFCLDSEMSGFKPHRKDRSLSLFMIIIVGIKAYFMISLLIFLFTEENNSGRHSTGTAASSIT